MSVNQSLVAQSAWTEALYARWWQRMGEIFGRVWAEQFGPKPSDSWREELHTWSVALAAAVLVHYRRAGLRFPPNLSEVAKTARELKPGLELPAPAKQYPSGAVLHAFGAQHRKDSDWLRDYRLDNPGITMREAAMALLEKRGIVHLLPEAVLAEARANEAATLAHEARADAARRSDTQYEAGDERSAIQSGGAPPT